LAGMESTSGEVGREIPPTVRRRQPGHGTNTAQQFAGRKSQPVVFTAPQDRYDIGEFGPAVGATMTRGGLVWSRRATPRSRRHRFLWRAMQWVSGFGQAESLPWTRQGSNSLMQDRIDLDVTADSAVSAAMRYSRPADRASARGLANVPRRSRRSPGWRAGRAVRCAPRPSARVRETAAGSSRCG